MPFLGTSSSSEVGYLPGYCLPHPLTLGTQGLLDKLLPLFEMDSMCHMALHALSNITHHGGAEIRTAIAFKSQAITTLVDKYPSDPVICELAVSILSHTVLACTEGPEHDPSIPKMMKNLDMVKILKTTVHCMTQPFSDRSCIEHGTSLLAWSTLHATNAHKQVPETAKILVAGLRSPDWGLRSICFGGLQRLHRRGAQLEMDTVNPQSFLSLRGRFPPHVNTALMAYSPTETELYRTTSATTEFMKLMTNPNDTGPGARTVDNDPKASQDNDLINDNLHERKEIP